MYVLAVAELPAPTNKYHKPQLASHKIFFRNFNNLPVENDWFLDITVHMY
jgi:hypothetical protein